MFRGEETIPGHTAAKESKVPRFDRSPMENKNVVAEATKAGLVCMRIEARPAVLREQDYQMVSGELFLSLLLVYHVKEEATAVF